MIDDVRHVDDRAHDRFAFGVENFFAGFRVDRNFGRFPAFVDVFETDDRAGFAGDRGAVSQPSGGATHQLANETGARRFAVRQEVANLLREEFDRGEVTERERNPFVVVVDRFREVDDLNAFRVGRFAVHEELELRGRGERVVAADRDERVDTERAERLVDGFHRGELFGVFEVGRRFEVFARVGARGADADALTGAETFGGAFVETDVGFAFLQNVAFFVVDEVGVAVQHAVNFDSGASEADRGAADDGVRGRGRPAGEEDSDSFNVRVRSRRTVKRGAHIGKTFPFVKC